MTAVCSRNSCLEHGAARPSRSRITLAMANTDESKGNASSDSPDSRAPAKLDTHRIIKLATQDLMRMRKDLAKHFDKAKMVCGVERSWVLACTHVPLCYNDRLPLTTASPSWTN